MTQRLNTITGALKIVSTLSADYDLDPTGIDSDLVAKFTKELNVGTLKNMRKFEGTITPANNLQDLAVFTSAEAIKLVMVFFSAKMGLRVLIDSPTVAGSELVYQSLVRHCIAYYPAYKGDYFLDKIQADTRTATFVDPTDLDQSIAVNYAIFTFEEA